MAIPPRNGTRDIRALARRVHRRWTEYKRRHPGMSIPINDTLSRILEHDPEYMPVRRRAGMRLRQPLRNPGVFTLKEIANALETTVGDLLGEPGYKAITDAVTRSERRTLRDAVELLRRLFDLDDEALGAAPYPPDFIAREFGLPEPFRVWAAAEPTQQPEELSRLREWSDPSLRLLRITADSMMPEIPNGCTLLIDSRRLTPVEGDLVAVYVKEEGGLIGRWTIERGKPSLVRSNASLIVLGDPDEWVVLGTVTTVVDHRIGS